MHGPKGRLSAPLSPLVLKVMDQVARTVAGAPAAGIPSTVAQLSHLFTKGRGSLASRYLDESSNVAAYIAYFMPVNLSKVQVLLEELPPDAPLNEGRRGLRLLDLGAGPGTGSLAVLDWLCQSHPEAAGRLSALAVDSSGEALRRAGELWNRYCDEAGISGAGLIRCQADLERPEKTAWRDRVKQKAPFDLILLANCLNELHLDASDPIVARAELLAELLQWLSPHGTLMLLEPALRETARGLHRVRDRLLREKRCTVYSPCLHEQDCPALRHPDDWCHEERAWNPPAHIQEIDEAVGFIKDSLKFSYLLLRTDGTTIAQRSPHTFRIVSELRELKGDTRAWVCNELGRSEIGRLDRAASETNVAWGDCQRGAIVQIEGLKRKDGATLARIPSEGIVQIVRPV
ncbi:MAG: small ribosomal subunit Rsm22 family protein [Nitrospira sp.]|nr:small ribosomal subunit Rsm22 family protein [Nitrospira sp.]